MTYHYAKVAQLVNNYDTVLKATTTSINSENSAMDENAKHLDSIAGRMGTLKASVEGVWDSAISSDFIKGTVSGLTGLVTTIGSVVDTFGGIGTSIIVASTALFAFNKNLQLLKVTSTSGAMPTMSFGGLNMTGLKTNIDQYKMNLSLLRLEMAKTTQNGLVMTNGLTTMAMRFRALTATTIMQGVATGALTVVTTALNMAMGMFIGMGVGLAVNALISLADKLVVTKEEAISLNKELTDSVTSMAKSIADAEALQSKINSNQAESNNPNITAERKIELTKELLDLQGQMVGILPETANGYDEEGKMIATNNETIKETIRLKKEAMAQTATEFFENNKDFSSKVDRYAKLIEKEKELKLAQSRKGTTSDVTSSFITGNGNTVTTTSKVTNNEDYTKEIKMTQKEMEEINKLISEGNVNLSKANLPLEERRKIETSLQALILLQKKGKEEGLKIDEKALSIITQTVKQLTRTFDESMDKISAYNKLSEEYNTNGSFSSESVKEIIDKHQELAGYLNNEPLLYQKIQEALNTEKDTANKVYREMMINSDSYYESNIKNTDIIKKALGGYYEKLSEDQKKDLENTKNLASAKLIVEGNLVSRLITLRETLSKLSDNYSAFGNPGKELEDTAKIAKTKKEIAEAQASVDAINTSFDSITADIKTTSVDSYGTSTTKALNASKKATEAYDNALTSLNNTMEEYDNKLKNVSKGSQEYRNILLEKQKIIKAEIELTKQQIAIQDKLAKTTPTTTTSGNTTTATSSSSGTYTGKYADWINASAKKYGLDPRLIAGLIQTESGFNPNAVNKSSGATGLGQFLASTAKDEGLTDRTDPQSSIEHLVAYLKKRIGWAGGDVNKGIMGYGEGTTAYLNKVLANAKSFGYGGSSTQSTSNSSSSTDTSSNDAQAKSLQLQKQLLDKNQQLLDLPYLIFESYLTEFDDRSNEASKRISVLRNELEMTSNDGTKKADLMNEIIANLEKELTIAKEKEAFINQEIASRKYTNGQLDEMNKKLLDVKETQSSIALDVRKAYEEELNIVKDVQEKIMDVIRKRYDEEKDLIQKQQDEYNKSNETDDYNKNLSEEQKKLADIQAKIDIVKRDPNAKAKLADLLKEAEAQQKAIDDMVLEHQRDLNNDIFDEKKKAIDDKSTDEKLVQLASDAISKGFLNLGGKIIDIKSAYVDFENRFGEGLKATGQLIKSEFIEKLEQAQALIKQLQDINIHINATGADGSNVPSYAVGTTNVPSDTLAMIHAGESIIPSSINPFNGSNFINMIRQQVSYAIGQVRVPNISASSTNGMNFNMNQPFLVIQGNVAKDSIGDLEKMVDKKMKDFKTLMKDALQSQGIY